MRNCNPLRDIRARNGEVRAWYRLRGGSNPIDGISAYRAESPASHWHLVTYGFGELHSKTNDNPDVSGFGFELTFRLAPQSWQALPSWTLNFLQNLGRYVFKTGNAFECGHYMDLNGPIAIESDTAIQPKEGRYVLSGHQNIIFNVEKSIIRRQDGSVQEVVG